jgi:GAF domain-containing protein
LTHGQPSVARLEALVAEQAALRRVATLVAADPEPRRLFDTVCEEDGSVLGVESANVLRYEDDGTQPVVGAWAASGAPISRRASSRFGAGRVRPRPAESFSA